jgi:uncharacterized protein YbcI
MERAFTTGGQAASRVSTEMVGFMRSYVGRGPTKARTYVNTNLVCVILHDTLTRAEESLVAAGQAESVVAMRRTFHEAMREKVVTMVEQLLERRVLAYLSTVDPHNNVGVETFVLEPMEESGMVEVAETDGDEPGREGP